VSSADVTNEAVRIFGDSVAPDDGEEPHGGGDVAEEPTWDIDVR
jgi:hypothetical protein